MKKISLLLMLFLFFLLSYSQTFELIDSSPVIVDLGYSQGCAWGDYDNDGNLDFYVTNSWTNGNNLFYHNEGDGTFKEIITGDIANDGGNSNGCTWGDYDNDGYLDLFVANVNNQNNFLYHNNKDGTFIKVVDEKLTTDGGWSYGAAWGDYDNDGFLDLYVANYQNQSNFLYHNNKDGTFDRISEGLIVEDIGYSQNCVWADFNNDNFPDLFVANIGKNCLYANNQNGSFTKITNGKIVTETANSFGCSVADYNNDGFQDVFVANWNGPNFLYKNLGNFTFEKVLDGEIVTEFANSEGSAFGDYDNDGDLDIFITNDGENSFYENNGDNSFQKKENINIVTDGANSNGTSWADYNNDGFLDLFIANGGNQTNLLYKNLGNYNNWINIKCIGTKVNTSAIGVKVSILATIFGKQVWQYHEISSQTGGGYGSQNSLNAEFGIGNATIIDEIIIEWSNTKIEYFYNIDVNVFITIIENENVDISKENQLQVYPNPFYNRLICNVTVTKKSLVNLKIFNQQGQLIKTIVENKYLFGQNKFELTENDFFSKTGMYFCVLQIGETLYIKKMISFK